MSRVQKAVSHLSLEWCTSMAFTRPLKVGSANWESDQYVAFTRVSLVFFSQLHHEPDQVSANTAKILRAFKCVRVLWFCLVSRLMTDVKVDSTVIDNYVKLFLSACKRLHECAEERFEQKAEEQREEANNKKAKKSKANSAASAKANSTRASAEPPHQRLEPQQRPSQQNPKKTVPFLVSAANYQCLLNMKEQIEFLGSLRDMWEGLSEGFIKYVKGELTTFRHDPSFLSTTLRKLFQTHYIDIINSTNNVHQRRSYSKMNNVKSLKVDAGPNTALETNVALSGLVGGDNQLYICTKAGAANGGGHNLHRLKFDDAKGVTVYDLYYATVTIDANIPNKHIKTPSEMNSFAIDYFLLVKNDELDNHSWTVICRSWKVRNEEGVLALLNESGNNYTWQGFPDLL